jgi:hypothetical protein
MAFRIEKRAGAILTALLLLATAGFGQQPFSYQVWHGHSRPPHIRKAGEMGALTISGSGVSFQAKPHSWNWAYQDIQQLKISDRTLTVLTYDDNKWKLGADREYRFDLAPGKTFADAYPFLKSRLDQRFVAAMPTSVANVLWEVPVKRLLRFGGHQGVLQAGPDEIVYKSSQSGESRTWRYQDIENISSSGPFQLTITTYERAKMHYGDLKGFNFELKQPLGEDRYNDLWLRLNRSKGLKILNAYSGN